MEPYFSVILPIYRVEAYLDRCVQSILKQSFTDYELILVDDGSPDGCPAMCDAYAAAYDFIRVVHKENGGLSSARNAGAAVARGRYIWWVDSDDWVEEGALGKLYAATCQLQPDIVKLNYCRVSSRAEKVLSLAKPGMYEGQKLQELRKCAFRQGGRFVLSAWAHVYRRQMLAENGLAFVSERVIGSEDYLFNLQAFARAELVLVLGDVLYDYELRMGSLSQKYRENLCRQYEELYHRLQQHFAQDQRENQREAALFYVWHLIFGTCIPHEYKMLNEQHSLSQGRSNVRQLLKMASLQQALKTGGWKALNAKRRFFWLAMRCRMEPFFYWLFVRKKR